MIHQQPATEIDEFLGSGPPTRWVEPPNAASIRRQLLGCVASHGLWLKLPNGSLYRITGHPARLAGNVLDAAGELLEIVAGPKVPRERRPNLTGDERAMRLVAAWHSTYWSWINKQVGGARSPAPPKLHISRAQKVRFS